MCSIRSLFVSLSILVYWHSPGPYGCILYKGTCKFRYEKALQPSHALHIFTRNNIHNTFIVNVRWTGPSINPIWRVIIQNAFGPILSKNFQTYGLRLKRMKGLSDIYFKPPSPSIKTILLFFYFSKKYLFYLFNYYWFYIQNKIPHSS